jgi:hypothetical protein
MWLCSCAILYRKTQVERCQILCEGVCELVKRRRDQSFALAISRLSESRVDNDLGQTRSPE